MFHVKRFGTIDGLAETTLVRRQPGAKWRFGASGPAIGLSFRPVIFWKFAVDDVLVTGAVAALKL
jgi:hypothetical protein